MPEVDNLPVIPRPEVLETEEIDRDDRDKFSAEDHRTRADLLSTALDEVRGYANTLWDLSAAMRVYLHENTPRDGQDDTAWKSWQDAYAATVSALCGPRGDSGFGAGQAQVVAQNRRAQ